jgi:uncharacterized damage-inducible protein DinB
MTYPPLDITPIWANVNEDLIEIVDLFGEEQLNWSPQPERWSARGILLHCVIGRFGISGAVIQDGKSNPEILKEGQTAAGLKSQLRSSWARLTEFVASERALAEEYDVPYQGKTAKLSGHWLAFGLLEHDIHHRGELVGYLDLLGIAHAEPDSVERRLKELLS